MTSGQSSKTWQYDITNYRFWTCAAWGWGEPLIRLIQPNECRAPEVLLGIGWSYSADTWSFGAMIWQLLKGQSLYYHPRTQSYSPAQHLADMTALIGDIPLHLSSVRDECDTGDGHRQP
ncbi:protein kinase domain-containing protein, partial [Metarhizium majus ARSEF 297]